VGRKVEGRSVAVDGLGLGLGMDTGFLGRAEASLQSTTNTKYTIRVSTFTYDDLLIKEESQKLRWPPIVRD
jgi:hypothetical protein